MEDAIKTLIKRRETLSERIHYHAMVDDKEKQTLYTNERIAVDQLIIAMFTKIHQDPSKDTQELIGLHDLNSSYRFKVDYGKQKIGYIVSFNKDSQRRENAKSSFISIGIKRMLEDDMIEAVI